MLKECATNKKGKYEKEITLQELADGTIKNYIADILMWLKWADGVLIRKSN